MERYDREDAPVVKKEDSSITREKVRIDPQHQEVIKKIFLKELKELRINDVLLVNGISNTQIVLNDVIRLDVLSKTLGKKLKSKEEFIKEYYMYMLDKYTDEAYGKPVTAIQEFPYSFQAQSNENLISYSFIS